MGGGIFQTYCTPMLIRICLFAVFAIFFLAILLPIFLFNEYNDAKNNECKKFGGTCIEKTQCSGDGVYIIQHTCPQNTHINK